MIDDAVPATCGNGVIAMALLVGWRPCTSGMAMHSTMVNNQKFGMPPPVNATAVIATVTPIPISDTRRTRDTAP